MKMKSKERYKKLSVMRSAYGDCSVEITRYGEGGRYKIYKHVTAWSWDRIERLIDGRELYDSNLGINFTMFAVMLPPQYEPYYK